MLLPFKAQEMDARVSAPPARIGGGRSRLRRLLVRMSSSERAAAAAEAVAAGIAIAGDGRDKEEIEPASVCLDRMVQSYIEDGNHDAPRPQRSRCNCFNGASAAGESSDDDSDFFDSAPFAAAAIGDAQERIKSLVPCESVAERNLLADAAKIVDKNRKNKSELRRVVSDGLKALSYDAAVCTSRWEKSRLMPSGEHEYIDVITAGDGKRLIMEVDFKSEFEVARPTKAYRLALQALPSIFVGTPDRLSKIVSIIAEAARQSMKKKGLHVPPWRKPEFMLAKWLSPHERTGDETPLPLPVPAKRPTVLISPSGVSSEFELRFGREGSETEPLPLASQDGETILVVVSPLRTPEAKPRRKMVTGLSLVL